MKFKIGRKGKDLILTEGTLKKGRGGKSWRRIPRKMKLRDWRLNINPSLDHYWKRFLPEHLWKTNSRL